VETGVRAARLHGMGARRYVLSVDNDNEFRSRCECLSIRHFGSTTYVLYMYVVENPSVAITFVTDSSENPWKNRLKMRKIF
jgi:hypothetical protein